MIYPPSQKPPIWSIDPGVIAYNCQKAGMPHPVLAMPFWEGAGNLARDYSGHGNHGALTNSPEWVVGGLEFTKTDTDYINCGRNASFDVADNLTIVSGLKLGQASDDHGVLNKGSFLSNHGVYAMSFAGGNCRLRLNYGVGIVSVAEPPVGVYTHIATTYDKNLAADNLAIYYDGELKGNANYSNSINLSTTSDVYLGAYYSSSYTFNGIIEYIFLFDTTLTAPQIKFIADNPYFMYQIPEELYGYVAAAPPVGNPFWYYNMLKRRN